MANLLSSKKRAKTNLKRQEKNVSVRTNIKTVVKKVEQAVADSNLETAQTAFSELVSALDSASTKGVIKKNSAARKKSRLAKQLNSLKATKS